MDTNIFGHFRLPSVSHRSLSFRQLFHGVSMDSMTNSNIRISEESNNWIKLLKRQVLLYKISLFKNVIKQGQSESKQLPTKSTPVVRGNS